MFRRQRGVVHVLGLGDAGRGRRRLLRRLEPRGQPPLLFSDEFCFDVPSLSGLLLLPPVLSLRGLLLLPPVRKSKFYGAF